MHGMPVSRRNLILTEMTKKGTTHKYLSVFVYVYVCMYVRAVRSKVRLDLYLLLLAVDSNGTKAGVEFDSTMPGIIIN